jgi:hypothetical protein
LLHLAFIINALLFAVLLSSFPSNNLFLTSNNLLSLDLFNSLFNLLPLFKQPPLPVNRLFASPSACLLIPNRLILRLQLLPESLLLSILSVPHGLPLSLDLQLPEHLQPLNLLLLSEVLLVPCLLLHPLLLQLLPLECPLQEQPRRLLLLVSHHLHSLLPVLLLHFPHVTLLVLTRAQHHGGLSRGD